MADGNGKEHVERKSRIEPTREGEERELERVIERKRESNQPQIQKLITPLQEGHTHIDKGPPSRPHLPEVSRSHFLPVIQPKGSGFCFVLVLVFFFCLLVLFF